MSPAGVTELLASSTIAHRRAVATELGLAPAAPAQEIGTALGDRERIAEIVAGLSAGARGLAAEAAFLGETTVHQTWTGRNAYAAWELERSGLAFAFQRTHRLMYTVPRELQQLLADALAAPHGDGVAAARPARMLRLSLQLAHDMAKLWAFLVRSPVRVKNDGVIYRREVPKLFDALPEIELHGVDDPLAGPRLGFVLSLLREERLVRIRVDERPGAGGRRELIAIGDPAALLAMDSERLRARLLTHVSRSVMGAPALALVRALQAGATVKLTSFGKALRQMCEETGVGVPHGGNLSLGLGGLHYAWLAGAVALGLDREGLPSAVRVQPAAAEPPGRFVCQGNFEVVALSPPTPSQSLVLALVGESVPEQAHVFKLTRKSVRAAQRSGVLDGDVTAALERLAGELPQNVSRSILDWTSGVRRPLRLRTAMILDAGDCDTADSLLAGELAAHVVERLGPTQLAVRAADVDAMQAALGRAGHELDAGIGRVSGRFTDREPTQTEAELTWAPDPADEAPNDAKQVSTLSQAAQAAATAPTTGALAPRPSAAGAPQLRVLDQEQDPIDVVLDAIERETDLFIVYAGADGTTQYAVTPYELDGAALRAYCHPSYEDQRFWLGSIQAVVALD